MTPLERITPIIHRHARHGDVTPQARLREDLGFDSLDAVELAMDVEDEFGIDLADDDKIMTAETVGDFVALVNEQVSLKNARAM